LLSLLKISEYHLTYQSLISHIYATYYPWHFSAESAEAFS